MKKRLIPVALLFAIFVLFFGLVESNSGHTDQRIGLKYLNKHKTEQAIEYLLKAVEKDKNNEEYRIDLGFAYIQKLDIQNALEQFDMVLANKEGRATEKMDKAALRGKGIAYYINGQNALALEVFEEALAINELPKINLDIMQYQGLAFMKDGEYEQAIDSFTYVIKQEKKNANLYALRGKASYLLGNVNDGVKDYKKAISLDRKSYQNYIDLCAILKESGQESLLYSTIEEALNIKTKTELDQYHVAQLNLYYGKTKEAATGLKNAVDSGIYEAYYYLGELAVQQEDFVSAALYYEKYLELEEGQKKQTVFNQLAWSFMKLERYQEAIRVLDKGLEQNDATTRKKLLHNQIIAYERMEDFGTAYGKAQEYMQGYPDDKEMQRELEFLMTRASEKQ